VHTKPTLTVLLANAPNAEMQYARLLAEPIEQMFENSVICIVMWIT